MHTDFGELTMTYYSFRVGRVIGTLLLTSYVPAAESGVDALAQRMHQKVQAELARAP